MRKLLAEAAQRAASYLESLPGRDVGSRPGAIERLAEALDGPLPSGPSSPAEVLAFLDDYGSPATVASAGGRYFGFVTGGALPAHVAAQYLAAAWDQNSFSFVSSPAVARSEENTSELQSLMRISYAVFCLKKKKSKIRTYSG